MKNRAVFAGTFDPFTLGHYDIVKRAAMIFDELYVAVAASDKTMFTIEERVNIARASVSEFNSVTVEPFGGFLVNFMREKDASVLVRGLRNTIDFEYEKGLWGVYKSQYSQMEACYFIVDEGLSHISSSIVRECIALGGEIGSYVCPNTLQLIKNSKKR